MKIVYIYHSLAIKGGIERIFVDKMNYLARQMGHEVYFFTFEQGSNPPAYPLSPLVKWTNIDIRFYSIFRHRGLKRYWLLFQKKQQFRQKIQAAINQIQPEIVITTASTYNELPTIMALSGSFVRIVENHLARHWMDIEKKHQKHQVWTQHWKLKYEFYTVLRATRKADRLVVLTEGDRIQWKDMPHTTVLPNMLNHYPPTLPQPSEHRRAISVGRLVRQKGYHLLIDAWKGVHGSHPDWTLDIYGEGEEYASLTRQIAQSGLTGAVQIHPFQEHIYDRYLESDFYVMSSLWEGFGLVLIEAMACALPCIAFNCPYGPSDIIGHREDGVLVPTGNVAQLAGEMIDLIEHPHERHRLGDAARRNVQRYLPENIMPQWEELFRQLTEQKKL